MTQIIVTELDDKDELLRYMDFSKFLYLVKNKELYLPRADCFKDSDKFEGYYTKQIYEISKSISIGNSNRGLYEQTKIIKESAYIICWMKSQYESMAHWDIYGGKNSVAIKTTVGKLREQLNRPNAKSGIYGLLEREIIAIKYIDHHLIDDELAKKMLSNPKNPLKMKNLAFNYEQEVRVIYSHLQHSPNCDFNSNLGKGLGIKIEPNELISGIMVSPKADSWFHDLVADLMIDYHINHTVEWSKLYVAPFKEPFDE